MTLPWQSEKPILDCPERLRPNDPMHPITETLQPVLAQHPYIRQVIVFGSVAAGRPRADSDLDIAVQARRPLTTEQKIALIDDLTLATGRPIDLIDLKTVGEPLLGQIIKHGQRITGSDDDFVALVSKHLLDAADFLPYVERMLDERQRAWTS